MREILADMSSKDIGELFRLTLILAVVCFFAVKASVDYVTARRRNKNRHT